MERIFLCNHSVQVAVATKKQPASQPASCVCKSVGKVSRLTCLAGRLRAEAEKSSRAPAQKTATWLGAATATVAVAAAAAAAAAAPLPFDESSRVVWLSRAVPPSEFRVGCWAPDRAVDGSR